MFDINIVAVLVASGVSFVVGIAWYSPLLFGKQWTKLMGYKENHMQSAKVKTEMKYKMPIGLLGNIIQAFVLAVLFKMTGVVSMTEALMLSAMIWLGFMNFIELGKWLWGGKKLELYYIDTAHALVVTLLMGGVLVMF